MEHGALIQQMIQHEQGCPQRIHHFLSVFGFAKAIAELEAVDMPTRFILETAAITHDIGIKPSLEKYGHAGGKEQQEEGPPIAEKMLSQLGYTEAVVQRVSFLISKHHTYKDVMGIDWQILLEADFLVNAASDQGKDSVIASFEQNVFKTQAGLQMLRRMYM